MFVVMALVTTFLTTPLTTWLYPKWYQTKVTRWRRGEIDWNGKRLQTDARSDSVAAAKDDLESHHLRKLLVHLRLDSLSGICTLVALLGRRRAATSPTLRVHPAKTDAASPSEAGVEASMTAVELEESPTLQVHGVRLMELTDRDSSVMKVSEIDEYTLRDPVVNTFRAFGQWNDISVLAGVSVVPEHSFAETIVAMAQEESADLLLIPWSDTGSMGDQQSGLVPAADRASRFNSPYAEFASRVLSQASTNIGIYIERACYSQAAGKQRLRVTRSFSALSARSIWSSSPAAARSHHIVLPFIGGDDDRFALRLVLQLVQNEQVTSTIIRVDLAHLSPKAESTTTTTTVKATDSPGQRSRAESDAVFFNALRDSLPTELSTRVLFRQVRYKKSGQNPYQMMVTAVRDEFDHTIQKAGNIVVVGRRHNWMSLKLPEPGSSDQGEVGLLSCNALGPLGEAMVRADGITANVLVVQAGGTDLVH